MGLPGPADHLQFFLLGSRSLRFILRCKEAPEPSLNLVAGLAELFQQIGLGVRRSGGVGQGPVEDLNFAREDRANFFSTQRNDRCDPFAGDL